VVDGVLLAHAVVGAVAKHHKVGGVGHVLPAVGAGGWGWGGVGVGGEMGGVKGWGIGVQGWGWGLERRGGREGGV